jgi:hypothetical protein
MQELSIDVPFLPTGYCVSRYCPNPLGLGSFMGRTSSGRGWLVERHYGDEAGHSSDIVDFYVVKLVREEGYVARLNESVDPLSAVVYLKSDTYAYKDIGTAKDAFSGAAAGQNLASTPFSQPLNILGYDEGILDVRPQGLTTLRVRTGRIVLTLAGGMGNVIRGNQRDLQDGLVRGLVYAMANLLARADEPAEQMTLKGKIYFNDQILATTKQDVGGDIVFLKATIGPYMLAIDEFYSRPDFELKIDGTAGLKGKDIEVEFTSDACGEPRNPDCFAAERITFQPGTMVEADLHFTRK